MSVKYVILFVVIAFLISCSDRKEVSKNVKLEPVVEKLNLENIDFNSPAFEKLKSDTSFGKEYIDFSYNFVQTSLVKRHFNTMGLAIDPSTTEYIRRFSYSYKKAGEHQKAMQLLQLSLDEEKNTNLLLDHLDYVAWNYLYFYRDYPNTIKTVDQILELSNNDLGASCHGEICLVLKGQALYRMKKYEEAIQVFSTFQAYEKEQGFNPMDNSLLVFYKARCLAELNQYKEAVEYFSHLLKNHPHGEASYQLAKLHFKREDYELVKKHLNEVEQAIANGNTFKEPFIERFDKVFQYQIDDLREKIH
ncbi:MAG: tetratricopeptide repeat protein [Flavobacteriaceae bacterium]|nr:tetratricopeptide repeat protein [Flavobacteriaceae bacterium]